MLGVDQRVNTTALHCGRSDFPHNWSLVADLSGSIQVAVRSALRSIPLVQLKGYQHDDLGSNLSEPGYVLLSSSTDHMLPFGHIAIHILCGTRYGCF